MEYWVVDGVRRAGIAGTGDALEATTGWNKQVQRPDAWATHDEWGVRVDGWTGGGWGEATSEG